MTNDQLLAAWKRKLPDVEPTDRELSAFALGVEVAEAKSELRAITFGDLLHQNIIAMRAAVVAAKLEGLDVGMQWIANTLRGPGHLPDIDEARALGGAQALWDKETAEHEAFRAAHPVPGAPTRQRRWWTTRAMTMIEDREKLGLALCPFCGGTARFGKCAPGEQEGENDGAEYVECCDCGASTCLVFPLMDSAKQVLRDMWNRRTDARHEPLTEAQIVEAITAAGCHGGAMRMSYGSGPYEITRPTINAVEMVRAVERAHGIGAKE